ncbi:AidA/PixA family protein [Sorangium sp. So ce341]|uniref:AidA/PixA family protein n=1 Tax=Sorangium sp. So ce341 TaxID=3133302 RepID=UPI003F6487A7
MASPHYVVLVFNQDKLKNACEQDAGQPDAPLQLPSDAVFMLSEHPTDPNWGKDELEIEADVGDQIQWHVAGISASTSLSVMIYAMEYWFANPENDQADANAYLHPPDVETNGGYHQAFPGEEVSPPINDDGRGKVYSTDISSCKPLLANASYWQTTVNEGAAGSQVKVAYSFRIVLFERDGANVTPIGYFTWDPYILINAS